MSNTDFKSLLPPNRQPLETALERVLHHKYSTRTPELIADAHDPQRCPAHLLPWLAYAESVDVWSDDWTEARKRTVIAASLPIHRIKGTRGAIELALAALGQTAELIEWWETPGQQPPCTAILRFDAETHRATGIAMRDVLEAVNRSKRLSLHISTLMDDAANIGMAGLSAAITPTVTDLQLFEKTATATLHANSATAFLHGVLPPQPPAGTQLNCVSTAAAKLVSDNNHAPDAGIRAFSVFGNFGGTIDEYLNRTYTKTLEVTHRPSASHAATVLDSSQPRAVPRLRATATAILLADNIARRPPSPRLVSIFEMPTDGVDTEQTLNRRYTHHASAAVAACATGISTLLDCQTITKQGDNVRITASPAAKALVATSALNNPVSIQQFMHHRAAMHFEATVRRPNAALGVFVRDLPSHTKATLYPIAATSVTGIADLTAPRHTAADRLLLMRPAANVAAVDVYQSVSGAVSQQWEVSPVLRVAHASTVSPPQSQQSNIKAASRPSVCFVGVYYQSTGHAYAVTNH